MFLLWLRQLPWCGDRNPASVPPPAKGRSSPTNTLVFPPSPSFYQVLRGSIYSFPLVRYSCPLSAGVLHALLCLKVYFWCICGKRCTPRPPTPLPSCFHVYYQFFKESPHYSPQWLYQFNHRSHWLSCPPFTPSVSALTLKGPGRWDWEGYRRPEAERLSWWSSG